MAILNEISDSAKSKKDFDITPEELKSIEKNLKNEEFRKMFFDYVQEISDPNNRMLYEQELAQLEAERGNSVRFVRPTAGFVVKTFLASKDDASKQKVFVNVCSSVEIEKAECTNLAKGQNWRIPYSLSQEKKDVDKAGKDCKVFDSVFHPETLAKAKSNPAFERLLVQTAMEGIEKQFPIIKLDNSDYKILTSLKSKGDLTTTMIKRSNAQAKSEKPTSSEFIKELARKQQELYHTSDRPAFSPVLNSEASEISKKENLIEEIQEPVKLSPTADPQPVKIGPETPKYTITHQGLYSDYQKFSNTRTKQFGARPDALVIRISLPRVESAGQLDLDITESTLELSEAQDLYALDIDLPFPVYEDKGTAKFDKTKRELVLTLPVIPAAESALPAAQDEVPIEREGEDAELNDQKSATLNGEELVAQCGIETPSLEEDQPSKEEAIHVIDPKPDLNSIPAQSQGLSLENAVRPVTPSSGLIASTSPHLSNITAEHIDAKEDDTKKDEANQAAVSNVVLVPPTFSNALLFALDEDED